MRCPCIAHGVVRASYDWHDYWHGLGKPLFLLLPPDYKAASFNTEGAPAYIYNSKTILRFAYGFRQMSGPAGNLIVNFMIARGASWL